VIVDASAFLIDEGDLNRPVVVEQRLRRLTKSKENVVAPIGQRVVASAERMQDGK
jgi:hypothetical protein